VKPTDVHRWMTYCLDFDTGKIVWEREAHKGLPRNRVIPATPMLPRRLSATASASTPTSPTSVSSATT